MRRGGGEESAVGLMMTGKQEGGSGWLVSGTSERTVQWLGCARPCQWRGKLP